MAGTKMTLRRTGGGEVLYWDEFEIIVDQKYIDEGHGLYVTIPYEYALDTKQLEVHFNGQWLSDGGGYEEIDPYTILLDLGVYPLEHPLAGQVVPLIVGDEIHIKVWKPEYIQGGGSGIDDRRFKLLEDEVINARRYKDTDTPYKQLDDRLDYMQERAESKTMVFVISRVFDGVAKLIMPFPYEGVITAASATCSKAGETITSFQIEKCSQANFDSTPIWSPIFSHVLSIEGNQLSSRTAAVPYSITDTNINQGDVFRINVTERGEGIEGVTIELMVKIK